MCIHYDQGHHSHDTQLFDYHHVNYQLDGNEPEYVSICYAVSCISLNYISQLNILWPFFTLKE